MAIYRAQGFETDDTVVQAVGWTYTGTTAITSSERHRNGAGTFGGSQSLRIPNSSSSAHVIAPSAADDDEFSFAIKFDSGGSWSVRFTSSGGGINCALTMGVDGILRIYRGTSTVLATGSNALTHSTWYWITVSVTAKNSPNGAMEAWINGVSEVSVTGDDLAATAFEGVDGLTFQGVTNGFWLDDYHHASAGSSLPELFAFPRTVTGDDTIASTSSGGGAGTYANVDETPVSASDYNEFTAAGADLYSATDTMSPSEVACVHVMSIMTGDGAITTARNNIKLASTTENGTYQALATGGTYSGISDVFETVGGSPLTGTDVDNLLHGPQVA